MGNEALKRKLKQESSYLGNDAKRGPFWTKLDYFYEHDLPEGSKEKYEIFQKLIDENSKLQSILEDCDVQPAEDNMQS